MVAPAAAPAAFGDRPLAAGWALDPATSAAAQLALDRPHTPGASAAAFGFQAHLFPVRGPHREGATVANVFGSGHKGQDIFADCGTPILAAQGGTVRFSGYEGAAGNYVVVHQAGDAQDAVYMHLRHASPLADGDRVDTGGRIGEVGRTGDADGCHLHFELWTAPGWYRGGHPHDPLPALEAWDGWS
ncbi:MAG: peptidoglycan LD-endopeptidase LytH [Solirubrobacteraceae bacterium]|nr:peptidoglycan LD-endopeptidase LytH [Solirubrobacteraceae bacterium]